MARINGVEVKALKTFVGHDGGGCLQGNVYLNKRKLGFWSQDAWCGPDMFDIPDYALADLEKACEAYMEGFPDEYEYKEFCKEKDVFMYHLVRLKEIESNLKKGFKEGYPSAIYVTDGGMISYIFLPEDGTDEYLLKKYSSDVEEMKKSMRWKNISVTVYRPSSFDIIVDKDNPAPDYLMRH